MVPDDNDFVQIGLMRLAVRPGQRPLDIPSNAITGVRGFSSTDALPSGEDAMMILESGLQRLQEDTGFVEVHRIPLTRHEEFRSSLSHLIQTAPQAGGLYLWCVKNEGKLKPSSGVVTVIPYDLLRPPFGSLRLELPLALLDTPGYQKLHDAYQKARLEQMVADAHKRKQFYVEIIENGEAKLSWWRGLSPVERAKLPPTIEISVEVNLNNGRACN